MGIETAAMIGALVAAGGTAYSMDQSAKQSNEADKAAKLQKEKQAELAGEAKNKKLQDAANLENEQANARRKVMQGVAGTSAVATSPLGIPGTATGSSYGGKTLLGA